VSSAVVIFEKRKAKPGHTVVFSFGGTLTSPAKSEDVSLDQLRATKKWTSLPRQGKNVDQRGVKPALCTLERIGGGWRRGPMCCRSSSPSAGNYGKRNRSRKRRLG
jgi:hypothetical protein